MHRYMHNKFDTGFFMLPPVTNAYRPASQHCSALTMDKKKPA